MNALTGSNGAVVETYEYQAFGRTVIKDAGNGIHGQSPADNPFMYTSREYDAESRLYFYRARYYDPDTGRFLQEDPIPSINQYAYAENNPILLAAPLGLWAIGLQLGGSFEGGGAAVSECKDITVKSVGAAQ